MKFGLFYEHQLPKPYDRDQWDPDAEHKLLKNAPDQVDLADPPGLAHLFDAEHRDFYDLDNLWGDAGRVDWQSV